MTLLCDESWVYYFIEFDSIFARQFGEVISKLRRGISTRKVIITAFFRARQLIVMDALHKWQKYPKNISLRTYFSHCLIRRSVFSARKPC
jgi:hypothetical protein